VCVCAYVRMCACVRVRVCVIKSNRFIYIYIYIYIYIATAIEALAYIIPGTCIQWKGGHMFHYWAQFLNWICPTWTLRVYVLESVYLHILSAFQNKAVSEWTAYSAGHTWDMWPNDDFLGKDSTNPGRSWIRIINLEIWHSLSTRYQIPFREKWRHSLTYYEKESPYACSWSSFVIKVRLHWDIEWNICLYY